MTDRFGFRPQESALFPSTKQSRPQSNACARARMLWGNWQPEPLNLGVPVLCRHARLINVKPIAAQEKFNFPRGNAILARAQALLWVRDCLENWRDKTWRHFRKMEEVLNCYVTNPNPTPSQTPNPNRNSINPNQINKKIQRNNF
jgi:hypothetical protein